MVGWGSHCLGETVQGTWTPQEQLLHINVLEFKAVVRCLKHFLPQIKNKVVLIVSDNATTVAYLRSHGGVRVWALNILSFHLSLWAKKHGITHGVSSDKTTAGGPIKDREPTLLRLADCSSMVSSVVVWGSDSLVDRSANEATRVAGF